MAPVALVLTTHLLMQQVRWRHRHTEPDQTPAPVTATATVTDPWPVPTGTAAGMSAKAGMIPGPRLDRAGPAPELELRMAGHEPDTTTPNADSQAAMSGLDRGLQARARQIYEEYCAAGKPISGAALAPARYI